MRKRISRGALACGFLGALAAARPAVSSEPRGESVAVGTAAALPADVATIDGIVRAYYEVISGPAGQPRQWARDRTLYIPNVRFVSISESSGGKAPSRIMTHQEYVDRTDAPLVAKGFDEREIHRTVLRYGEIASVFSTYESRQTPAGPVIARGINSLQLYFDGTRWWIVSATWRDESAARKIPSEYLP